MGKSVIRDRFGSVVGSRETTWDGREVVRDRFGQNRGSYDTGSDTTRDRYGNVVGHGDHTGSLLPDNGW